MNTTNRRIEIFSVTTNSIDNKGIHTNTAQLKLMKQYWDCLATRLRSELGGHGQLRGDKGRARSLRLPRANYRRGKLSQETNGKLRAWQTEVVENGLFAIVAN